MTANGGEKDVDDLVQSPKTTDPRDDRGACQRPLRRDHRARYVRQCAPFEAKNMKALCKTFAMVPKDVKANGSTNKITHTDSTGGSGVGSRRDRHAQRPARHAQEEPGPEDDGKDTTGATVKQLPADVEKDCLPVGDEAEYVSFTALHEVGHGRRRLAHLHDAQRLARGPRRLQSHGAAVQVIADAVGPHIQKKTGGSNTFYSKPEDKKYVLDKLLNQKPAKPGTLVAGSDDAKAYDAFDRWHMLATSDGIWDRQGDAEEIAIGGKTVYHEAQPREWVSYLAWRRARRASRLPVPRPGRMVRRAVRRLQGEHARAQASGPRLAEEALTTEEHRRCRSFRTETVNCPACATPVEFELVFSVNADRRPDLRDAIVAGTFQRQPCPSCGTDFGSIRNSPHGARATALHRRLAAWPSAPAGRRAPSRRPNLRDGLGKAASPEAASSA
jgi:endogenous inhibitor of DNA gyrase (YacG/DUF329 family)